jgi:pyrimidine-nucleoside phosphorylase
MKVFQNLQKGLLKMSNNYFKKFLVLFMFASLFCFSNNKFHVLDIIQKKRDNQKLSKEEINFFVDEYTHDKIADYQASSFLMAVFLNGMDSDEIANLTDSMLHSGDVMDFSDIDGYVVDKHSTGGVGDKTSIIIAPVCAALGLKVPMISGRGLGHTGGTLDKLESIPGFRVDLDLAAFKQNVKDINVCMIGQTKEIAPADKKIYALRNATGTVEHMALIASSIMSKKLAENIDGLVMDVKFGCGAFMKSFDDAKKLAQIISSIGKKLNKHVICHLTDMNQPLGMYVGNALEIEECAQLLQGKCQRGQEDLKNLTYKLISSMLLIGNVAKDEKEALKLIDGVIEDGSAFLKFQEIIKMQGGDPKSIEDVTLLPTATKTYLLKSKISGYVKNLNALEIAKGCFKLGAGRGSLDEKIDMAVGAIIFKKKTDFVNVGDTLLEIRYNDDQKFENGFDHFKNAYEFSKEVVKTDPLIKETIF